jgi:hypothetical protein
VRSGIASCRRQLRDNAAARSIAIGGEEACSASVGRPAVLIRLWPRNRHAAALADCPVLREERTCRQRCLRTAFDPTVWTGRALQAGCEQMKGVGLAHLYPALAWSVCAPGHHGYPRAPDLILRKALRGRLGHQITGATARPFLHLLKSNSQTSAGIAVTVLGCAGISLGHPLGGSERVDLMRPLVRRALRSCDLVPTQSKRSAPAYWRVRLLGHYGVSVVPQP